MYKIILTSKEICMPAAGPWLLGLKVMGVKC